MAELVCPLCGVATSFSPVVLRGKGIILAGEQRRSILHDEPQTIVYEGVKLKSFSTAQVRVALRAVTDESDMLVEDISYAILTCQACGKWFVAAREDNGEWSAVHPIAYRPVAEEIPEPIKSEFEEAHLCFAVGAYRACVSMCETALEATWRIEQVSSLKQLKDKGAISDRLYRQANEIRLWANVAKHELIHEAVAREEAEELLAYLEAILDHIFVQPTRLGALSEKRQTLEQDSKAKSDPTST